jgi:hypothetical protein
MKPKIVALKSIAEGSLGIWVDRRSSRIMIGGRVGNLTAARELLGGEGEVSYPSNGKFRIVVTRLSWEDLLTRLRAGGYKIEAVRSFRRLVY